MSRYTYNKKYVWTPHLAYCVGLIASDGSLSKNGRHIDFTTTDYDLALTYRSSLKTNAKIGAKKNSRGQKSFRVQIGDVSLYDFLVNTGLTPNKSLTIAELGIPDIYYRDFLRGCFDGDGTAYTYMDKRWKSSHMYYLCFTSASEKFVMWLQRNNIKLAGTSSGSIMQKTSTTRAWRLGYAKQNTKKLYEFMYYKNGLPHLARKKEKVASFFTDAPEA